MSHEIRTPLNAILGFTQLMLRDPALGGEQRQHLQTISRSGEHLLSLINDVLEMSKIEAGRTTLHAVPFDLHALVDDLAVMIRVRTDSRQLRLAVEVEPEVPRYVQADESKLRQVLINLLGNAVKFTERGGIALRVSVRPDAAGLRLAVEAEDTGVGIPEEERERIFGYFEQTAGGTRAGGTGLGLAISREFVRLMGGEISVDSVLGRGSVFRFDLPLEAIEAPPVPAVATARQVVGVRADQRAYRILVADDRPENRHLLSELLRAIGLQTVEACDGAEAVAAFESTHPHLVMMDLRMPVTDGYEAIRRIRALPEGADVPIIAVTASAFIEDRDRVLAAGANAVLGKPYREEELFACLGEHLGLEYPYAESPTETTTAPAAAPGPSTEALAAVRPHLVAGMQAATVNANLDRLLELIAEVAVQDPRLAAELTELARTYQ